MSVSDCYVIMLFAHNLFFLLTPKLEGIFTKASEEIRVLCCANIHSFMPKRFSQKKSKCAFVENMRRSLRRDAFLYKRVRTLCGLKR